jgi:hypothetical protein
MIKTKEAISLIKKQTDELTSQLKALEEEEAGLDADLQVKD